MSRAPVRLNLRAECLIPFDALPPIPVTLLHRLDQDAWRTPLFLAPDMPDDPTEDA